MTEEGFPVSAITNLVSCVVNRLLSLPAYGTRARSDDESMAAERRRGKASARRSDKAPEP
jgi:hypothetical protein